MIILRTAEITERLSAVEREKVVDYLLNRAHRPMPVSTGRVVAACSGLDAGDNKCGEPVKEYSFGICLREVAPPQVGFLFREDASSDGPGQHVHPTKVGGNRT